MHRPHDTPDRRPTPVDDLSALAWVHDELRRSLETAHKALRRYLKEAEAVARLRPRRRRPGACCAARARSCTRAWARSSWSACRPAPRAARQRERGAALRSPGPQLIDAGRGRGHRARLVRAARLPGAHARRQAGVAAGAVPAVPRACRSWPAPTACTRPTCGRDDWQWQRAAGRCPAPRRASADAAARAAHGSAGAGADAQPPTARPCSAHERPVRRPRRRRCAQAALADAVAAGGGLLRSPGQRPAAAATSTPSASASRLLAQLRAERGAARPRSSDRLAQDLLFFCAPGARARRRAPAPRLAAVRAGLRRWTPARPVDYDSAAPGPLRPGLDRAGAQARGRRQGRLVGGGRRRSCTA